ncbi:MAG: hypothetical protein O9327_05070 [Polaromonas sp.]|nr:hypothetical protein [Polaromonas sp.]
MSIPKHFVQAASAVAASVAIASVAVSPATAQLAPFYNQLMNTIQQQLMNQLMARMGLGVEGAVLQSGAATQAEVLKKAAADKAVAEGLEAYRQQEKLRVKAQETAESLVQPNTTCETMAVQGGVGASVHTARARAFVDQKRVLAKVNGNANTVAAVEEQHQASNLNTCTEAEKRLGICEVRNPNYAGADQNAAFLFQGRDGSMTYEGGRDGVQSQAADAYIQRMVATMPPEQLKGVNFNSNPAGRAYVELTRRHAAMMSMSAYSLGQIKQARTPQEGLGDLTSMANVTDGGFAGGRKDMSMLEAVQRFVAMKFSPKTMTDSAGATNVNQILRDMAQTNAFQLWIEQQTLLQDARTEGLMAHQLVLLTDRTLRPALEAQRAAATSAATARR